MKLKIKQVTGAENLEVEVETSATIADLKQQVAEKLGGDATAEGLRLIYRGQILKDPLTVESYGLQADHVVHMVRSKPAQQQGGARPAGTSGSAASAASGGAPAGGASAAPVDPLAQAMGGLGFGGAGAGGAGGEADMMQQMLQSPMTQALMRNPQLMRMMMQSNPAVRQMMEANPELGRVLTDPDMLRQLSQVMSNPALMREQMRNADLAMSNIESMPGGFNALREFHSTMQPLDEAMRGGGAEAGGAAADNPFAELFQPTGAGSGAQQPAAGAPNEAPLPNPWAAAGGGGGGGGAAPAGLGGLGGMGGMGGMGMDPAQMQQLMSDPGMQEAMQQMMADPAMQQLMQQQMSAMLATPEGQAQMTAMLEQNPMYQSMVGANPQMAEHMRSMFSDPQRMRSMMDPRTQRAMQQMAQAMQELQGAGLFPDLAGAGLGMPGAPGAPGAGGSSAAAGGMPDLGALLGMLGGGGAGGDAAGGLGGLAGLGGFGAPPPPANPEEAYATQLQQLQDMGFYDRDANLRALLASGGNVNAAVERLLAM